MIPLDGTADLPPKHKAQLLEAIEHMQARDSLRLYNNVVERCFTECVSEFRRKELDHGEEKCISKCCEKYLKHSQRVSHRFAELSADMERQLAEQMAKMAPK